MLAHKRKRNELQEMKRWKRRIIIFRRGEERASHLKRNQGAKRRKWVMKEEKLGLGMKR